MIQNSLNSPKNIKNNKNYNLPDKYKNIEKYYDNYIKLKNIINSYLSYKYKLSIHGFKIYPFFVIHVYYTFGVIKRKQKCLKAFLFCSRYIKHIKRLFY